MFIIYDAETDEFLSNNSTGEWGGFYFSYGDCEHEFDGSGRPICRKGPLEGVREFDPVKASFASEEEARAFAEKEAENLLKNGERVDFEICSISVENEITKRGGKVIKSSQYATVRCVDSLRQEPFEDDKTTEVEKVIGDLILENYRPHFDLEADEHLAARKIINDLREVGYEITKKEDNVSL
jgi:hypothetical protein